MASKEEKIILVVHTFLNNPNCTLKSIAMLPALDGISASSIQRYLNDPLVETIFGEDTHRRIKETLRLKGIEAKRKGGLTSFRNNNVIKGENSLFVGSEKVQPGEDNVARKIRHILIFGQLFLSNPKASLQDIADMYNEANPDQEPVTRDYVYDCLSEHEKYDIFSENITKQLSIQLEQRRILGNINGALATNSSRGK